MTSPCLGILAVLLGLDGLADLLGRRSVGLLGLVGLVLLDGRVIASEVAKIEVLKVGFGRFVEIFSKQFSFLYGALAVALSLSMGWIAGRLFARLQSA